MATNRVDKVLVTTGTAQATVGALTPRDYIVIKRDGTVNTPIAPGDEFQIVVGATDGSRLFSDWIRANDIKAVTAEDYAAKVEQVVTITVDAPSIGSEYSLVIVNKSDKEILQHRQDKRSYQVVAGTGETADTLAAKFRDAINDDPAAPVVASGAAAAIVLTAKNVAATADRAGGFTPQIYFSAGIYEVDLFGYYATAGTVVETTAPDFGSGNYWQVRTMEAAQAGYQGYLNRTLFPADVYPYGSVAGTNYDYIVIEDDARYTTNSVVLNKTDSPRTTVLAITAGGGASLETIFAEYLPPVAP